MLELVEEVGSGISGSPSVLTAFPGGSTTLTLTLVTLVILGLSVAWWFVDPGFEPLITGVAALAGLVSARVMSVDRRHRNEPAARVDSGVAPLSFSATPHTVGRDDVTGILLRELDRCRDGGEGRMVGVSGEAGIGKTTVAENFLAGIDAETATVARGRCSERLAGAGAYLPLLEALESLLRGSPGKSFAELVARVAPSWYAQLGPSPVEQERDAGRAVSQERLKRDFVRLCEHLSRARPFVLFLEDLHWADASTIDILAYLADRFDSTRMLVLATYRLEEMRPGEHPFRKVRPTLEQRGHLVEIPLGFL